MHTFVQETDEYVEMLGDQLDSSVNIHASSQKFLGDLVKAGVTRFAVFFYSQRKERKHENLYIEFNYKKSYI